ncbi:MAG: tetratricopeptide repeat protein [Bacteroidales bacterium]
MSFKPLKKILQHSSLLVVTLLLLTVTPLQKGLSQIREGSSPQCEQSTLQLFLKGVAQFNQGKREEAQKSFKALLVKDGSNHATLYYLSQIAYQLGELKEAREYIERAVAIAPNNVEYLKLSIGYLIEEGSDYKRALALLDLLEREEGSSENSILMRFDLLSRIGRGEEAIEAIEKLESEVGSPRLSMILGDWWAERGENSKAEHYFLRTLAEAPNYPPANFGLAEIYRVGGKFDLYFRYLFPFLEESSVDPKMKRSYIGQIMENRGFVQTFLPQIDSIWSLTYAAHPGDTTIGNGYAIFLVQSGRESEGEEILHNTVKLYPTSQGAAHQYLSLLYFQQRWDRLIEESNRILEIESENSNFLQFKGIAQLQLGNLEGSIETFKSVLRYSKDSTTTVNTLTTLGDLLYRAEKEREAFKYYKKAIKEEPLNLPALNNYAYYLSLKGRELRKAAKMSKRTIEAEPNNPTYLDTYAWIEYKLGNYEEAKTHIKRALLFGGKENAEILNHYATILFSLKEYDIAYFYWDMADKIDPSKGIAEKVEELKRERRNKK